MDSKVDYKVNSKENVYFYLRLIISFGLYFLIGWGILESLSSENQMMTSVYILYIYLIFFGVYLFFRFGVLIGHLKGNAIKLNKNQFFDIYQTVVKQSELLGLNSVPDVYILQSGGMLNAFAARFMGKNYIVLYSEVVEAALEQDKNILGFIIGHELGHIKRNHMQKNLLLFPSYLIPFLGSAYSRACEYTSDNIAYSLCPAGLKSGLLLLASGKSIYKSVNVNEYLAQEETEGGFWKWYSEKVSSHPNLTKRIGSFAGLAEVKPVIEKPVLIEKNEEDHSRYFPK